VVSYSLQSLAIVLILINSYLETREPFLIIVILTTLVVKVVLSSVFFVGLVKRKKLTFSASNYLNIPLTLILIAMFTVVAHSEQFSLLTNLVSAHNSLLSLSLATIFISLFLTVNRKGALSQALGVLSLENSILAFALFAGLEKSPMLQIGIIFDIAIWIVIATVFISMIYEHFGSLDTSLMKKVKN
jgi:hydrogenase-4 membrane subunit HyfE